MTNQPKLAKVWCSRELYPWFPISPVSLVCFSLIIYWFLVILLNANHPIPTAEASHILLPPDDKNSSQKILTDLKITLQKDPTQFVKMAQMYSTCPSGKDAGGNLGNFSRGTMTPAFDKVVFDSSIPTGTILGPIQTPFGWHLIVVHKRQGI
jgi:peptidyl-prolyl cis-trans isomerase C